MIRKLKKTARVLLCLTLCALPATEAFAVKTPAPSFTPGPPPVIITTPEPPKLTDDGFWEGEKPYIHQDEGNGHWLYISDDLNIKITRCALPEVPLVWYETEIRVKGDQKISTLHTNPERIGRRFLYANDFCRDSGVVLGFSDDFYGFRVYQKRLPGIIIQDGKLLAKKTRNYPSPHLPNYDVLARFPDGSLKAYDSQAHTAEEFMEMGVTDTWCFGPVVISDGVIGRYLTAGYYKTREPRQVLGMIEPNHYLLITVDGRQSASKGTGLLFVAHRMRELGVTEAMNLDGGNSVQLVFLGQILNKAGIWKSKKALRTVCSLITVGKIETAE